MPMRGTRQVIEFEGYSRISSKHLWANLSPHPKEWDTLSRKVLAQWSRADRQASTLGIVH